MHALSKAAAPPFAKESYVSAEPVRMRRLGTAAALATALLISGCAAGQHASTAQEKPSIDGTNATLGTIALRGLVIEPPAGATPFYGPGTDAAVKLVIVNSGTKTDTLTNITSPTVGDWGAFGTTAAAAAVVAADNPAPPSSAAASSASSPAGASSGAPSSASSPAATSAQPPSVPTGQKSVPIVAGGRVSWGVPETDAVLLLLHATKRIYPGTTVPVTFTFANAGSITVAVPVGLSSNPQPSFLPAPTSSAGIGG